MTRCRQGRHLRAYMDGELPLPQREQLRQHLSECAQCAQELRGLEHVEHLLAQLSPTSPPPHLAAATLSRLRAPSSAPVYVYRHAPVLAAVTAAAACLVFALHVMLLPAEQSRPAIAPVSLSEIIITPGTLITPVVHHKSLSALKTVSLPAARPVARRERAALVGRTTIKAAVKTLVTSPTLADAERRAAAAFTAARHYQAEGDPDLTAAALENVALKYPGTQPAAQALLAAAELQRQRGNLSEADAAYRRLLEMHTRTRLPQALAHKALGELRTESVGEDEVARYHYREAARALKSETTSGGSQQQALLVMADTTREAGSREETAADFTTVASHTTGEPVTASLADLL